MPTTRQFVTLFVSLWLIARDSPPTPAEVGWMVWDCHHDAVWDAGRLVGLVRPGERSWVRTPPVRGGDGLVSDCRCDLARLRERAHPAVPVRMPPN